MEFEHTPVLLEETIEYLGVKKGGVYLDLTLGKGGHSKEILKILDGTGLLIGVDQDREAIEAARENLKDFSNVIFVNKNYEKIEEIMDLAGVSKIDGALMDIGVSSYQIDNGQRGFSYMKDGPLDMRMDEDGELNARDIVNSYSQDQLEEIFSKYGEERYSKTISRKIVEARKTSEIRTTFDLRDIVREALPSHQSHPEKRVFQALRIEVNRELEVLESTLEEVVKRTNPGGRLAVITFHSLEDRIVKDKFKEMSMDCICPKDIPVCICGHKKSVKILTKKPVVAGREELKRNSRSKSAKLRACERI